MPGRGLRHRRTSAGDCAVLWSSRDRYEQPVGVQPVGVQPVGCARLGAVKGSCRGALFLPLLLCGARNMQQAARITSVV